MAVRTARQIRQVNTGKRGCGRGRQGCGGRGSGNRASRNVAGSSTITLRNGKQIKYHPSIRYTRHQIQQFKPEDYDHLRRECREWREMNPLPNVNNAPNAALIQSITAIMNGLQDDLRAVV